MQYDHRLFTTTTEEGWIEVVPKRKLYLTLSKNKDSIGIIPTGWCNNVKYVKDAQLYVKILLKLVCSI
jgi:hypothetical protein